METEESGLVFQSLHQPKPGLGRDEFQIESKYI